MGCASSTSGSNGPNGTNGSDNSKPGNPPPATVQNATKTTNENNSQTNNKVGVAEAPLSPSVEKSFKPIHSAFRWNKPVSECEKLLTGPDAVNSVDTGNGNRPIHIVSQNGHDDLVRLLIKHNCEINAKNFKGNTALHMAIGYDYYVTAKILISAGGDLEALNEAGVPAKFGLEGDKCLGLAALVSAKTPEQVVEAFDLCEQTLDKVVKISFAQAGLKAKKALGDFWTSELQDRLKSITSRLP